MKPAPRRFTRRPVQPWLVVVEAIIVASVLFSFLLAAVVPAIENIVKGNQTTNQLVCDASQLSPSAPSALSPAEQWLSKRIEKCEVTDPDLAGEIGRAA